MAQHNPRDEPLGEIVQFPTRKGEVEHDGPVLDGELVDDAKSAELDRRPIRRIIAVRAATVRHVRIVASHEPTVTAARFVARNVIYIPAGFGVVARRVWDSRTTARHQRMMQAAEARGDLAGVAEWEERSERAKAARHGRAMDWLNAPVKLARALAVSCVSLLAVLLGIGIVLAVTTEDIAGVLAPFTAVLDLVRGIVLVVGIVWGPLVLAAPWLAVVALWNIGRRRTTPLPWLVSPHQVHDDAPPIIPSVVVKALRDLGVRDLRKAIDAMGDAGAGMLSPIVLAGCGVEVTVALPSGVSTSDITSRHRRLAENLGRHEHEVFITIPTAARSVHLWISDPGALDEPIGPSPLVLDETLTADLYTGRAPWGQDLRGDAVTIALLQRHLLLTGLSNQGKTAALRALALWLALDVTVEFHIADLKGIGDWHMFTGLAATMIAGPTDEHVIEATHMLEAGVREMQRRLAAVDPETHKNGVTRDLARSGQGFHPIVLIVDEAQQAFMCPAVGDDKRPYGGMKNKSRYFMAARKLHNQGRAVNVILWQGTQNPTDQNLPKLVREGAHIRGSLVLGTEAEARMALGDKAVNAGAAPHKLRQGLDKGTLVIAGDGVELAPGQASITVRTHFVDGEDADTIADRAKALRAGLPGSGARAVDNPVDRDLLEDVDEVLRGERVKATDVVARLRELAPTWPNYQQLNGTQLVKQLTGLGVRVPSTGGVFPIDPAEVSRALARRATADLDDE